MKNFQTHEKVRLLSHTCFSLHYSKNLLNLCNVHFLWKDGRASSNNFTENLQASISNILIFEIKFIINAPFA
jgi:hypothetical protein